MKIIIDGLLYFLHWWFWQLWWYPSVSNDSSYKTTDNLIEETTSSENLLEESLEKDFVEEYWEQHPDEDPCNDPTAKAFGLCP